MDTSEAPPPPPVFKKIHIEPRCDRDAVTSLLSSTDFLDHRNPDFFHGRLFKVPDAVPPASPIVTWESSEPPRKNHDTPDWLIATEYLDHVEVLKEKVKKLAELMSISKRTVVYRL